MNYESIRSSANNRHQCIENVIMFSLGRGECDGAFILEKKLHRHSMVTKYIVYCIENRKKYDKQLKIKLRKCGSDLLTEYFVQI